MLLLEDIRIKSNHFKKMILNPWGCLRVESYVEDGQVVLAIADEGCGIPPENLRKVGTPFFTTKDSGTGLGLAICYKIVESHNAKIHIDSSSRGTTFFISFPIPDADKEQNEMISNLKLSDDGAVA